MREQLLYYAVKYNGNYSKILKAYCLNERYHSIDYQGNYICFFEASYPQVLFELKNYPLILFYEGDLKLLNDELISVVGSGEMSEVGKSYCELLMKHLSTRYTTVSGVAKGVDAYIHEQSFKNHKTIGIIGCGLDVMYPYENRSLYIRIKKEGLLLSEYPNQTKPYAYHFPWRNRLIAALSKKVIVIEAKKRSGTMLTVNEALELGRDVYCFPHSFTSPTGSGCNALIQEGSNIIVDIKDIIEL